LDPSSFLIQASDRYHSSSSREDTEDEMDQEQLEEYKEMVDDLGAFPVS
jgi:hypothetical protein